jgi:hydroxyisourate hydrolase
VISTHVLDTSLGKPAQGVAVTLELQASGEWTPRGQGVTDADGRAANLEPPGWGAAAGRYRLTFDTAAYFAARGMAAFFPAVQIVFDVTDPSQKYHVPLLLSPFGYSTYRGS